jgi:hypothetical protein
MKNLETSDDSALIQSENKSDFGFLGFSFQELQE